MSRAKRYRDSRIDTIFVPAPCSIVASMPSTTSVPAPGSTQARTPASIPASTPAPAPTPTSAPAPAQTQATTLTLDDASPHLSISSKRQSNRCWTVDVIDEQGVIKEAQLNLPDIWMLPLGQRIVVHFNEAGQPIGEAAGILGGFTGAIASDVKLFPISYRNWKRVPNADKERCYKDIIKGKFYFDDAIGKHWMLGSIAKHWRDNRSHLFREFYKEERSKENVLKHPGWIPQDMWVAFVNYRLDPTTVKMCETNTANRKKLVTPHTGGSKSFARKRHEMETRSGRPVSRGALYIATRKRKDGSYVNDEARIISEKISNIEAQQTSSQIIGQQDSLAQVFGPEHSGRVRGLGFGPTPSKVFRLTTYSFSKIHSTPNADGGVSAEKLAQLVSQLQFERKRLKQLENCMQYMLRGIFGNA